MNVPRPSGGVRCLCGFDAGRSQGLQTVQRPSGLAHPHREQSIADRSENGSAPETPLDEEHKSIPLGFFGRTPPFTKRQRRVFLIATTAGFFDQHDRALLTLALRQIQKGLQISEQALGNLLTLILSLS